MGVYQTGSQRLRRSGARFGPRTSAGNLLGLKARSLVAGVAEGFGLAETATAEGDASAAIDFLAGAVDDLHVTLDEEGTIGADSDGGWGGGLIWVRHSTSVDVAFSFATQKRRSAGRLGETGGRRRSPWNSREQGWIALSCSSNSAMGLGGLFGSRTFDSFYKRKMPAGSFEPAGMLVT